MTVPIYTHTKPDNAFLHVLHTVTLLNCVDSKGTIYVMILFIQIVALLNKTMKPIIKDTQLKLFKAI